MTRPSPYGGFFYLCGPPRPVLNTMYINSPRLVVDPPKTITLEATFTNIPPELYELVTGQLMPDAHDPTHRPELRQAKQFLLECDLQPRMQVVADLLESISEQTQNVAREERERAGNLETYPENSPEHTHWSPAELKSWIEYRRKRTEQRGRLYDIVIGAAALTGPTRTTQRDVDVIVAALLEAGVTITEK